ERACDSGEPITEDDATLEAALEEANIPALMTALVHLTGDVSIVRSDIRPDNAFFGDPQGGIPEDQQKEIRRLALQALKDYRDRDCELPPVPDEDTIREMMNFLVGEPLPDEYIEFLQSELSLAGEDPYGQPAIDAIAAERKAAFRVVVIGSGMSGILAGIRLRDAGIPYTIIEKNTNVGGTWLENTYPGCRVDSPNHTYSYSFAPKDWPQHFSSRDVLHGYFDNVATEFGIRQNIRFNTEVEKAEFDESSGEWQVHVRDKDGNTETLQANAVISAVGQLNRPRYPDIKGVDTFKGPAFHSARWEHDHDLKGKRIGVIGTGASAFQFVPEIAKEAKEVVVFQRTPPWIAPREEYHDYIPEGKHWLLNKVPYYAKWFRFLMFWRTSEGLLGSVKKDPSWNQENSVGPENDQLRAMLTEYIEMMVGDDPELLEKCVPKYPPAGKRMLVDNGTWLTTLRKDHVHVITDPIEQVNEQGVRTESGDQYDVDVLIFGTGFHANKFLWPMEIKGRGGVDLQEHWDGDPRAYLGVTIPGFPNLFCMYGPNTNIVVNGSIIFFSECEIRYILGCIALLLNEDQKALDCRQDIHDAYNQTIDEGNLQMAWGAPNVNSWYKNEKGRVTQNWPFTLREFWERTRKPDPSDFNFV
ncbi:MAG: NAD(P)/FAD-dependent oxidoreductase, partial [Pseudomonadales bacterium]|nr:NAD(P)/FAD-dependent oxidoreductase [Pseudomonadales bacterium]